MSHSFLLDDQLALSVFLSDLDDARALLARGANPDARDEERRPALTVATAGGDHALMRLLLESGADPNLRDDDGLSALDTAVLRRDLHGTWLLLRFGAEANGRDDSGMSTFLRAVLASGGSGAIVDLLQRSGAQDALASQRMPTAVDVMRPAIALRSERH